MPTISVFLGIIIRMYNTTEHNPPHFHAFYQGHRGVFNFDGELIEGTMPPNQVKYIAAWATLHRDELEADWALAQSNETLVKIDPLR